MWRSDAARVVERPERHYAGGRSGTTHRTTTELQMNDLAHAVNGDRHTSADGLHVLIVDDNRVIRDAVAALLVNEDGLGLSLIHI